jgi:hypothetical protein
MRKCRLLAASIVLALLASTTSYSSEAHQFYRSKIRGLVTRLTDENTTTDASIELMDLAQSSSKNYRSQHFPYYVNAFRYLLKNETDEKVRAAAVRPYIEFLRVAFLQDSSFFETSYLVDLSQLITEDRSSLVRVEALRTMRFLEVRWLRWDERLINSVFKAVHTDRSADVREAAKETLNSLTSGFAPNFYYNYLNSKWSNRFKRLFWSCTNLLTGKSI